MFTTVVVVVLFELVLCSYHSFPYFLLIIFIFLNNCLIKRNNLVTYNSKSLDSNQLFENTLKNSRYLENFLFVS